MSRPSAQSSRDEAPPDIPSHTLHRRIGRGTYGEVWLATDAMSKWRAVKVVSRREDGRADHGYEREFNAINQYEGICHSHGSLMPILTVGRDAADRYFYYSMELADDARTNDRLEASNCTPEQVSASIQDYKPRTLRAELRRRGRLSPSECVAHGIALATALERLHAGGLIHRDIKPDNIIFVHGLPKLADVGSVADVEATYSLAGTTAYLSPEPERKEPADIFALGLVLYEMTTGRDAEEFPAPPRDFGAFSEEERTAINELNAVCLRACDPDVQQRQASAKELREELELLNKGASVLRLRELEERDRHRRRLVRIVLGISATLVCASLLALLVLYIWNANHRAIEENRRRELREIQVSRLQTREAGWASNNWSRLERAAKIGPDQEVREQASALLAGLDARPVKILANTAASSAAFGPDGRALLGGVGPDGPAMLIDTNGVTTELPIRGDGPVCWTPDGVPLQLVVASNALVLRDARTGSVRREFRLARATAAVLGSPPVLAITPDGSEVAAGLRDRLFVWRTTTGDLLAETATEATALAFSPDGSLLAAGGADGTARVYGVPGLAPVAVLPPALRGSPILCLAFGRDPVVRYGVEKRTNSWLLATGDQGAGIVIWDLHRRQPRSFCRGSTWTVAALAFHPDGLTLASAGRNEPRLWHVASGQLLLRLSDASSGMSRALVFDGEGRRLICGGQSGSVTRGATVGLWGLERDRGIHALRGLASAVRKVWLSPNSARVAALSDDWHLAVWEITSGRLLFRFETPVGSSSADNAGGCFDGSGERFAFATGREARLYDLATSEVLQRWRLADGQADQLQFDRQGRRLLLRREQASQERRWMWRLYELAGSENPVLLHEQKEVAWVAQDMAFAPGGELFLVGSGGPEGSRRMICAYEAASGRELWQAATERTRGDLRICFDPTGRWFGYTAYNASGYLRLIRASDFMEIGTTADGYEAISPSGQEFADNRWLFLGRTGVKRIPLVMDWYGLSWISTFSPNGKLLVWGTEQGVVLVADIQEVQRRLDGLGQ